MSMQDITEEERAAIAAYRGPVQRIPRGASSLPVPQWDEKQNRLNYPDKANDYGRKERKPTKYMQKLYREQELRRVDVSKMADAGVSTADMAARLGVAKWTINKDLAALGKRGAS